MSEGDAHPNPGRVTRARASEPEQFLLPLGRPAKANDAKAKHRNETSFDKGIAFGSKGDGWGGPASGMPSNETVFVFQPGRKQVGPRNTELMERRAAQEAQLTEHLINLSLNAAREETQVTATIAALDRIAGKPVQRNLNINADVGDASDEELEAERAELRRKAAAISGEGTVVP